MKVVSRLGLSTAITASILVVIIIAAAGWGMYFSTATAQQRTITQTSVTSVTASSAITTFLAPTTSNDSFTIGGFVNTPDFADWYLVQQSGLAGQYIPHATFTPIANGAQIPTALVSGQLQMAFGDPLQEVTAIVASHQIQLVAVLKASPTPWEIAVAANSSYTTLQSLHGASFAVTSTAAPNTFLLEYELQNMLGWKLNTDYTLEAFGSIPSDLAATLKGSAAAFITSDYYLYPYTSSGQMRNVANFTLPYPGLALFSSTAFIQQHPDAVRATIEAFTQAGFLWDENSSVGQAMLTSHYYMPLAVAQHDMQLWPIIYTTDGSIPLSGIQKTVDITYTAGGISTDVNASSFVSTEFVPITY